MDGSGSQYLNALTDLNITKRKNNPCITQINTTYVLILLKIVFESQTAIDQSVSLQKIQVTEKMLK